MLGSDVRVGWRAYQYPSPAPSMTPSARRLIPETRRMPSPARVKDDLAYDRVRLALHLGGDAQEPAALHRQVRLERVDVRLGTGNRGYRRGYFAHCVRRHIDAALHDHRIGYGLAGGLVFQAHRHDDVVALLYLCVHRL